MPDIAWGEGSLYGSFIPILKRGDSWYSVIAVRTNARVEFQFGHLQRRPPFDNPEKRIELLHRLNQALSTTFPEDSITKFPSIPFSVLKDESVLQRFLEVLSWFVQQLMAS